MKTNEAEDMKKKRKESFRILTVGFKWGPLNFNFALTSYSQKFNYLHFLFLEVRGLIISVIA
jgi:hypothetical protein